MFKNKYKRGIIISLIFVLLLTSNFLRIQQPDCIRAIHIVTLIALGMAIGVFIMNVANYFRSNKES